MLSTATQKFFCRTFGCPFRCSLFREFRYGLLCCPLQCSFCRFLRYGVYLFPLFLVLLAALSGSFSTVFVFTVFAVAGFLGRLTFLVAIT